MEVAAPADAPTKQVSIGLVVSCPIQLMAPSRKMMRQIAGAFAEYEKARLVDTARPSARHGARQTVLVLGSWGSPGGVAVPQVPVWSPRERQRSPALRRADFRYDRPYANVIGSDRRGYPHLKRRRRKSVFPRFGGFYEDLEQAGSSRAGSWPRGHFLHACRDRHHLTT